MTFAHRVVPLAFLVPAAALAQLGAAAPTAASLASLPQARVIVDSQRDDLIIELPPVNLPASTADHETMVLPPPYQVVIPDSISIHKVDIEVVDDSGHMLPKVLLHHININDPTRRDLFLPSSLHVFAASKETPSLSIPRLFMGLPLDGGQRLLVVSMLTNPTSTSYPSARLRLVFGYTHMHGLFPLFRAFPFALDAMYPLGKPPHGSKAFDLPPGLTVKSWEGSPAVPGYIVGCGGHVHDYALGLQLTDATTGQVLWRQSPIRDSAGHVLSLPVTRFYRWNRLGIHIVPTHRYRMQVTYNNPTGHVLQDGGMGSVAGLFIPDHGVAWPEVDTANPIYQQELTDALTPSDMAMHGAPGASRP